jgi:uncharacterized membrane protein YhaH (DUF805 family)
MPNFRHMIDRYRELDRRMIEANHRKGRKWTVWFWSLCWGGFMFVSMTATDYIRRPQQQFKGMQEVYWLLFSLLLWTAAGYGFGERRWRTIERKAREL